MRYAAEEAKQAKESAEEAGNAAEEGSEAEGAAKLKSELEATRKALEETSKALSEQKEKLARSYADLENTVRIAKRDVAHAKEFGIKGFAVKMFDVLDTVELCLANLPKSAEPDSHLDSAIIALDSTKKQFAKVMAEYDVQPVETKVGDKFDANVHNAIFEMDAHSHDTPMKSVGAILKQGWTRSGTLLRPTHVGVVMRPHPSAKKE
jgi:molecular chaperone GrpE